MAAICLTGKGEINGKLVPRSEWRDMIARAGHWYTESGVQCDVLVASRSNTVKAVNARARGAKVISYDELREFLTGVPLATLGSARSLAPAPPPPPKPIDTTEMEKSEIWGLF